MNTNFHKIKYDACLTKVYHHIPPHPGIWSILSSFENKKVLFSMKVMRLKSNSLDQFSWNKKEATILKNATLLCNM